MSAYVPSRKFCCCIPVRAGVVLIGLVGLAGGGLIAVGGAIQAERSPGNKLAYIIQIIVYGLLAILSIFGIIGAIFRKRGFIRSYFGILTVHVLFSMASGVFSLYRFFQDAPADVNTCINNSTDDTVIKACQKGMSVMKGVLIAVFVFVWLMEIWGCIIVNNYSNQLGQEQEMAQKAKDYEASRPQW
ncbi:hypothetical protein DFH07DRAFT_488275 [Mycena maculata]|uniref:Tetraspanin n=1 Tax=Mycena maculata TaxID=230809 RepID=A0AAD7NC81_9AGAR|nr:hypothetical protein DFH07DRAFT_488275 [Mycena maculata]